MNGTRTLLIGVAACAAWGTAAALADPVTVYSEAKRLGDGFAQVYAELDGAGAPRVIGVNFDQGMLNGLPAMPTRGAAASIGTRTAGSMATANATATTSSPSRCRRSWCSAGRRRLLG